VLHVHDANRQGPTGRPRFLPVSWPPPGRDGAYAASVPSQRSLIRLESKRNAAEVSSLVGYTINVSRPTARLQTHMTRRGRIVRQRRQAAGLVALATGRRLSRRWPKIANLWRLVTRLASILPPNRRRRRGKLRPMSRRQYVRRPRNRKRTCKFTKVRSDILKSMNVNCGKNFGVNASTMGDNALSRAARKRPRCLKTAGPNRR
jgi:hypothetical protein